MHGGKLLSKISRGQAFACPHSTILCLNNISNRISGEYLDGKMYFGPLVAYIRFKAVVLLLCCCSHGVWLILFGPYFVVPFLDSNIFLRKKEIG